MKIYQDVQSASKNIRNAYDKGHKDRSQRCKRCKDAKQHGLRSKSCKDKDVSQVTASVGYNRVKLIAESDHYRKPESRLE